MKICKHCYSPIFGRMCECGERTKGVYIPTKEQIARACLEIQDGWTDEERHRRTAVKNRPVETFSTRIYSSSVLNDDGNR